MTAEKSLKTPFFNALQLLQPRSLQMQLMLLTSMCMVLAILSYGYFVADSQTRDARSTVTAQLQALAQNLATVNTHFLLTTEPHQIETLTLQTATVPGIYSVLVTDAFGLRITEVVNNNGLWSPRYSLDRVPTPAHPGPDSVLQVLPHDASQRDFLAGKNGTLSAWQRMGSTPTLGWVRINYRLDKFDELAHDIQAKAFKTIVWAIVATLSLLWLLLRPALQALQEATTFASQLDQTLGTRLKVSRRTAEMQSLGNALNVVSQRLALQHLDLSNQQFALDQHAIISITDLQGTITYANARFCDISGYSQQELLGQNHRIVKSDEHPPQVFTDLWHTIAAGKVWNGDIKNRKKDGSFYWVSATIVPMKGVDGLPHQYIGIRTDITANKNMEQSLQIAKKQAEQAATTKGQFLANMSHEIRTPMNAILGMLKLLQNTSLDKHQLDYASKAEGAAQSLLGLLNDILDFSKMDADKMTLEVRAFRLDKLLRNLSVIVSANVGSKPVEVLLDVDPAVPKSLIGDVLRLQQVLINLCGNAVKFTAQGEVIIRIKVVEPADPAGQSATLHFAVQDSGIGIAPENQQRIFDGFSQAEASTTRRFGGSGLGLSISRRLVALMGGELHLKSQPGLGSTFSFQVTLPISTPVSDSNPTLVAQALATPLHVLVVDDNPIAREVLSNMAGSLGWQVDVAAGGTQALAMIEARAVAGQKPYQALFIDWQMPDLDGWETVAQLQTMTTASPPIVMMVTALGRDMLNQRSPKEQAQLHGFLVKPVTASMLFDAVADALGSRAEPQTTAVAPAPEQPLQGKRLLVVEDNLINQQVAQELLSSQGAQVTLADNGHLGVEAVRQSIAQGTPFDVVLMDIQMPVMDGYAATHVLREELGLHDLPIIAMTANAMASDRIACLAAGMNDHVGKPFNLTQLVELIRHPKTVARRKDSRSDAAKLPVFEGVDTVAALERLGGNEALYRRILISYMHQISSLPDQLEACLAGADLATAVRLLHTFKGLSSTVGANHLADVARSAELKVKAAQDDPQHFHSASMSAELRTAMAKTQPILLLLAKSYAPGPAQVAAPVTQSLDLSLVRELLALLKASDMRATKVFEHLQGADDALANRNFQQLQRAMAAFDFAQAAQACRRLLAAGSEQT